MPSGLIKLVRVLLMPATICPSAEFDPAGPAGLMGNQVNLPTSWRAAKQ